MIKRHVTIVESPGGWQNVTYGRMYKTAAGAKSALDRLNKNTNSITVLDWIVHSKIGKMVVKALQP